MQQAQQTFYNKYLNVTIDYGVLLIQFWSTAAIICHYTDVLAVFAMKYFYSSRVGVQCIPEACAHYFSIRLPY